MRGRALRIAEVFSRGGFDADGDGLLDRREVSS